MTGGHPKCVCVCVCSALHLEENPSQPEVLAWLPEETCSSPGSQPVWGPRRGDGAAGEGLSGNKNPLLLPACPVWLCLNSRTKYETVNAFSGEVVPALPRGQGSMEEG